MSSLPIDKLIAKGLGYLIMIGAIGFKVPQIINIISSKSVNGLSALSLYLEVPLILTSIVYNVLQKNPFTSYGETVAISIQNMILVILLWIYSKPRIPISTIIGVCLSYIIVFIISINLPDYLQPLLVLSNLPLTVAAKIPQIMQNYRAKSTGPLSLVTTILAFVGSLARIFTTIKEIGMDFSLIFAYIVSMTLSGTLLLQVSIDFLIIFHYFTIIFHYFTFIFDYFVFIFDYFLIYFIINIIIFYLLLVLLDCNILAKEKT